ncbi:MAG: hypothetical protein ABIB97_02495 [Patescibacteria group bacterium]
MAQNSDNEINEGIPIESEGFKELIDLEDEPLPEDSSAVSEDDVAFIGGNMWEEPEERPGRSGGRNQAAKQTSEPLKKTNRPLWVLFSVALLGMFVFFLGFFDVIGQISLPFIGDGSGELTAQDEAGLLLDLQVMDTDEDTLTDYEELYLYNTSPYLSDSDSDGKDDATELNDGTDPNCPKGQLCGTTSTNTNSSTNTNTNESSSEETVTADQLRQTLIESGAPESTVNAMDDETIIQTYANQTSTQDITVGSLENLAAEDVRLLLRQAGVADATLTEMDDATLLLVFQEALNEINQ